MIISWIHRFRAQIADADRARLDGGKEMLHRLHRAGRLDGELAEAVEWAEHREGKGRAYPRILTSRGEMLYEGDGDFTVEIP